MVKGKARIVGETEGRKRKRNRLKLTVRAHRKSGRQSEEWREGELKMRN